MDEILEKTLSRMILSASGWRGIFAEDGDEESRIPSISEVHTIISAAAAKVFSVYLLEVYGSKKGAVIVGGIPGPPGKPWRTP